MTRFKFLTLLVAFSFLCGCERNSTNTGAPVAGIGIRQAWAENEFTGHWEHVQNWIGNSKLITESIGNIQDVAPIGKPNQKFYSFGEAWSDMNLEVIGTEGTGVLFLNSFSTGWNPQNGGRVTRFHDGTFETEHGKEIICKSGKGYLEEHGIGQTYYELMNYPDDGDPNVFLQQWSLLETLVLRAFPKHQSPLEGNPPMQGLDIYRQPLLVKRSELLHGWGLKKEAVQAHRDVVEFCLQEAQWAIWSSSADHELAASHLKTALKSLRAANELQPEDEEILKLARQRLELHHDIMDASQSNPHDNVFYEAASREVKSISFLKRELGSFDICDKTSRTSGTRVGKKLRYYTTVYLELDGRWDDGTVAFRFQEKDKLPPIDLFAENPRRPDYPLFFKSPKWKSASGEKVKISAKTGEPL